jgi:hypothetical protein
MQIKILKLDNRGLTLVEMLAAGIISTIVAGAFFSIYHMYSSELKETSAYFSMQQQYENVSEQIASCVRAAHNILPMDETYHDTCDTLIDTASSVLFYSGNGRIIGGFMSGGVEFMEYDTISDDWIPFVAGNGTVRIDTTRSWFVLPGCRDRMALHLTLQYDKYDTIFYLPPRKDEFICRN